MKKLGPLPYRSLFLKHIWRFLQSVARAHELSGNHVVAVSAGLDSMSLLWVALELHKQGKLGPVRAIFVNHQTRSGQREDRMLVQKFCEELGVSFQELKVSGLNGQDSNFEAKARQARKKLCADNLGMNELLWVGHHLDDSFEWNFMQRHRSSNPKSTVGIPVRNGKVVRPFLCVTRDQIKHLSRFEGIPFREDPTNLDLHHDRNYVRHAIMPLIRKRYPKYLKFYAQISNFSAMMLKISLLKRAGTSRLYVFEEGALLVGKQFSDTQIQELIHNYSNTDRGEIVTTIHRMQKAIDNGKKGPFQFSGGVEATHAHGLLMIYRRGLKNNDHSIANLLSSLPLEALRKLPSYSRLELLHAWQNLLQRPDALKNLPGLVLVLESDSICKTLNTSVYDPSFPLVSAVCKNKGLRFISYQKCLDMWMQKQEKLPEKLRLVPLSSLSHLVGP
jgi:tRNA(Ile)-lysidine synthase